MTTHEGTDQREVLDALRLRKHEVVVKIGAETTSGGDGCRRCRSRTVSSRHRALRIVVTPRRSAEDKLIDHRADARDRLRGALVRSHLVPRPRHAEPAGSSRPRAHPSPTSDPRTSLDPDDHAVRPHGHQPSPPAMADFDAKTGGQNPAPLGRYCSAQQTQRASDSSRRRPASRDY
jgi:hypothetical protein